MKTTLTFLLIVVPITLLLGAPAPRKKPNLIVNGSFEEGPPIGSYSAYPKGATDIKGWVVSRETVDLVNGYWQTAHGSRSIDLHGSPGLGGIQQTFKTTPGKSYTVTFSLAGNPDGTVPKKVMGIAAAGQKAEFQFDATGKTLKNMGWERKTWRFKAEGRETTLEFYTLMQADIACGPVIDDVSVTEDD